MTQKEALELLKLGHNVFLTGAAGSGKTYLLNQYIAYLREHGVGVAVTASTGIAATHLGGQTIHSWSGIGVYEDIGELDVSKLSKNSRIKRNFKKTKVLVIDEISMLHAHQLDMVEYVARRMLNPEKPFGGLQVILCGDFFQLPPVSSRRNFVETDSNLFDNNINGKKFAYECGAWENGEFKVCYLHEQFRQTSDPLLDVLNDIRNGAVGEQTKIPLRTRYKKEPIAKANIRPTKLFARNINVDAINERELQNLPGNEKVYQMETRGFKALVAALQKSCLAPEKLRLKIGAEVMFVKNAIDGRYVNGTRGIVERFDEEEGWPIVRTFSGDQILVTPDEWRLEEDGTVRATLSQVPLRLAWAITIHKSQGMTLDAAEIDLSDAFEPGMGYVALSRVRTLDGLKLLGLNETALAVHPRILSHDKKFREWSDQISVALKQFSDEEKEKQHREVMVARLGGTFDRDFIIKSKKEKVKKLKVPTEIKTAEFLKNEMPLEDIARERSLAVGTIIGHMEKLKGQGKLPDISYLQKDIKNFDAIFAEFKKSEDGKLSPVFNKFEGKYPFETLRLVRLFV